MPHYTLKNWLLLLIITPIISYSQGYQVNLQGQKQQAMGSAGTGLIQDASSLFFNPGGSCFVDGNSIIANFTPVFSNITFRDANNGELAHSNSPFGKPFSLFSQFEVKEDSKLKLGLAVYTPFGSTVSWEDGWTGRFTLTRLELLSIFIQPTVSYRITDKIGLGAGFVYSYGKVNLQKDLPILFESGEYASVELAGSGSGFGFNAGIYFEPVESISIGLTYRSEIQMAVSDGQATFNVPESLDENFPDGAFSSSLPLPQVFTLGIGFKPIDKLSFAVDANYIGWNAYDTLAFDYGTNTESLDDTKSPRSYKNTIAIRLGGQYELNDKLQLRAGVGYAVSPVQDGYLTAETPDANRMNYTIGVGYTLSDHFELNSSLLYTSTNRTDTNLESNLNGTFKSRVLAPGISLTYAF